MAESNRKDPSSEAKENYLKRMQPVVHQILDAGPVQMFASEPATN